MYKTPAKILFLSTLALGTVMAVTSTSWLGVWMGLEINLLSFIPLMTDTKNILSTEASLKYFLVQALASTVLLLSIILMFMLSSIYSTSSSEIFFILICSALLLKMGAAPFHFWFPGTMEGLKWLNCLILSTWQKIAPLMLLTYTIKMSIFTSMTIILSILIGSLGGLNQSSLRKLMAYSSINHVGWMIAAVVSGDNMWELYFIIYALLAMSIIILFWTNHIYHINQTLLNMTDSPIKKSCIFFLLLSLGGLPPFLGFFPKWLIIQTLTETNYQFIIVIMVTTTLITLFYYLRLAFLAFLFSYIEWKASFPILSPAKNSTLMLTLTSISTLGLPLSSMIYSML